MATMTMISRNRDVIVSIVSQETVKEIEGQWQQILTILSKKNIHVLPGGTIERYLPCFTKDPLDPKPEAKRNAVIDELKELQRIHESCGLSRDTTLAERYGELYEVVRKLPTKAQVDFDVALRRAPERLRS